MTTHRRLFGTLAFLAGILAIYYGMNWLTPLLSRSAFFQGLMVFSGIATLPLWAILIWEESKFSQTTNTPIARGWLALSLGSCSLAIAFLGLSYWFTSLQVVSYVFGGFFVISAVLPLIMSRSQKK